MNYWRNTIDLKQLLEIAGVDTTQGKAKQLVEAEGHLKRFNAGSAELISVRKKLGIDGLQFSREDEAKVVEHMRKQFAQECGVDTKQIRVTKNPVGWYTLSCKK